MGAVAVEQGGFAYLPGRANPFSNGVVALSGHALTRVRLRGAPALADGLAFVAAFLKAEGRPPAALAATELRSPAAMSRTAFAAFNQHYVGLLRENGFGDAHAFPVARSNMAPEVDPPATNTLFAFTYSVPVEGAGGRDFVISGKPENLEDAPGVVAEGDVTPAGMRAKAAYVMEQLRLRVAGLGASWGDITGAQIYTTRSLEGTMSVLRASGLANVGFGLFPAYPPVDWCEFEIDVRAVSVERVL